MTLVFHKVLCFEM